MELLIIKVKKEKILNFLLRNKTRLITPIFTV